MKVRIARPTIEELDGIHSDALCLFLFEDVRPLKGIAGLVDWRLGAFLSGRIESGWISCAAGERFILPAGPKLPVTRIFGFGLGPVSGFDPAGHHVAEAFAVLCDAGAHGAVLTPPGRPEGLVSEMQGLEAVCTALDPALDFDEVVIVDGFRRREDARRRIDLCLKPLSSS